MGIEMILNVLLWVFIIQGLRARTSLWLDSSYKVTYPSIYFVCYQVLYTPMSKLKFIIHECWITEYENDKRMKDWSHAFLYMIQTPIQAIPQ